MEAPVRVVDETTLDAFRTQHLSPSALYSRLRPNGEVLLINEPPGIGKTFAARGILSHALAHDHDLVIYIAPTRALIDELMASDVVIGMQDQMVVLKRRPTKRCGDLDADWSRLETFGCAALAKSTLCEFCPSKNDCSWPDQFDQINDKTKLVVATESYIGLNPDLIRRVVNACQAQRPLVVFDEASFMTSSQVRQVSLEDIDRFKQAVTDALYRLGADGEHLLDVCRVMDQLLDGKEDLTSWPRLTRFSFIGVTLAIQKAGQGRFGSDFRYIGHDLIQLTSGANAARWYSEDAYKCVPVPNTRDCDVVVFSPYLPPQIIEERLQRTVTSGLPPAVFRHSKTRFINIADSVGSLRSLSSEHHFNRVASFFAALVLRNKLLGKRTVLVTKKTFVKQLKRYIEDLATTLGRALSCRTIKDQNAADGDDHADVVIINYGILGINSLNDYDALYCLGGYYTRQSQLDETYNQLLPPNDAIDLMIRTENGQRRVVAGSADSRSRYHASRARAVLEMIERRVVLQAVSRVRPFTSPATVITFQQDDLSSTLGEVDTFSKLSLARTALAVPVRAELIRAALGDRLRPGQEQGMSYRSIAAKHDVPLSTVYKALATPPLDDLLRQVRL